jgi:cystathionine beta-synthase
MWHTNVLEAVGRTPLIRINTLAQHVKCTVLAKVEYFNPGNSVKDRIAIKMIEDAERAGILKPGGTIIEGTSGNTGMGLALAAVVKGYRCIFTITDKQSQEKIDILRAVGAEVVVCPTNVEPEDPLSYYSVAKRLAREIPNSFYPNQYDNLSNRQAHYETTGPELWEQTEGKITHFVAGMGTCGTICGTSKYLKQQNPAIRTLGVDTYGSLFQKLHETREIDLKEVYPYATEGIGEDFVPANCDMSVIDRIIKVTDKDAAIMTRKLARLEGLFVGWSCGSAMHGALEYAADLGPDAVMVVVLPDHGTRYLGKIYNDNWMRERGYLEEGSMMTADEILRRKAGTGDGGPLLSLKPTQKVAEAFQLMREQNISQIPVLEAAEVVGSVNESRILNALIDDPHLKDAPVSTVMNDPFPFVLPTTRIDVITKMITKENPAVLVQLKNGGFDIITKYDLISALANG